MGLVRCPLGLCLVVALALNLTSVIAAVKYLSLWGTECDHETPVVWIWRSALMVNQEGHVHFHEVREQPSLHAAGENGRERAEQYRETLSILLHTMPTGQAKVSAVLYKGEMQHCGTKSDDSTLDMPFELCRDIRA